MPRAVIDLNTSSGLAAVTGQWKFAQGLVPGQPNEGLVSQLEGSPARLPDYDDSGWEVCTDLGKWVSHGFSFVWYRIDVTFPVTVEGHPTAKPWTSSGSRPPRHRCRTPSSSARSRQQSTTSRHERLSRSCRRSVRSPDRTA